MKDGLIEGDILGVRGIRVHGQWWMDWRWTAFVNYDVWLNIYRPECGVSTVRIRLRRTFPLLGQWCAILALGHSGVTAWSGESGVSCHYRDCPEPNLKSNQFTSFKHKKGKTTCRLTTNVFLLLITVAKLLSIPETWGVVLWGRHFIFFFKL